MQTFARLGWLWLVTSCDPNVVIGSRFLHSGENGGSSGTDTGGSAGATSTSGTDAGAVAGSGGVGGSGGDEAMAGAPAEAGAGGQPVFTPIFDADHETGSLGQWDVGGDDDVGGYYSDVAAEIPKVSTEEAHSGTHSAKITVNTSAGDRIARLYRRIEQSEGYYSAWFFIAGDHLAPNWWSIFLFRAVKDRAKSVDLWSVDLVRRDDDQLTFGVFDHTTNKLIPSTSEPVVEVGKWFQLEAYLQAVGGEPSKVVFYLNGAEFLTMDAAAATPKDQPLYWVIGNGGSKLMPATSTIYVDDAVVDDEFIPP